MAYRSLSATDVDDLSGERQRSRSSTAPAARSATSCSTSTRSPTAPTTAEADAAKALAVRQAVANLVDREAIAEQVYKGTYTPLYSYVPEGFTGATEALKELYGDGDGGPDVDEGQGDPRGGRRRRPRSRSACSTTGRPLRPVVG